MGFPLGISSLTYLLIALVATYIKNMSVHTSLVSDWFTFFVALIVSNFVFLTLLTNFSEITVSFIEISYNTFFSLIFFPFFWFFFNIYYSFMRTGNNV